MENQLSPLETAELLKVGKDYSTDELLNMFPQSEGHLYIGWDELEEGNQYD